MFCSTTCPTGLSFGDKLFSMCSNYAVRGVFDKFEDFNFKSSSNSAYFTCIKRINFHSFIYDTLT